MMKIKNFQHAKNLRFLSMKKSILYVFAILLLSAVALAVPQHVVIAVDGVITDSAGVAVGSRTVAVQVDGAPTVEGVHRHGQHQVMTNTAGGFSALVGSTNSLMLECGTPYGLNIYVCETANQIPCLDFTGTDGQINLVGTYTFTACYGTQGAFTVPGVVSVQGGQLLLTPTQPTTSPDTPRLSVIEDPNYLYVVGVGTAGGPGRKIALFDDVTVVGNLVAGNIPAATTVITQHSLTATAPGCPTGWTKLWDGYSFKGAWLSSGYSSPQDLGGPGSCLEEFRPIPFIECRTHVHCDFFTDDDYSTWLAVSSIASTNPGDKTAADILSSVSRCSVCEKPAPILVRHSQTAGTVPDCPTGWTELWSGYSYMGGWLGREWEGGQDLSSPGSCLKEFTPNTYVRCWNPDKCNYWTDGDYNMWLTIETADTGEIHSIASIKPKIARCKVCSK